MNYDLNKTDYTLDSGEVYLTISRNEEHNILYLDWRWKYDYGFDCIKIGATETVEKVKEFKIQQCIVDLTRVEGAWDSVNDWIVEEWLPMAKQSGSEHWVFIQPKEFFANLSSELMDEGLVMGGLLAHNVLSKSEAERLLGIGLNVN